eukprot:GILI01015309.1.p1 GENE.GILI01015309.1~~GILI01015309.1.p1  ORF type:complete len:171 (+),score=33.08 GILI01015309.1:30-515(+)
MSNVLTAAKRYVGLEEPEEDDNLCPSLTLTQRLTGFAIFLGIGVLLEFLSFGSWVAIIAGKPEKFAILYTIGNICSLLSTTFLVGPQKQWKNMTHKDRAITSLVYIVAMIFTLLSACVWKQPILVLVFVLIQFCALVWYVLSYIPGGRSMMKSMCGNMISV